MNKWFILLLLGIFSCTVNEEKKTYALSFPIIIDTLGVEVKSLNGELKFPDYISTAIYQPFYIGVHKDSVFLCNSIGELPPPPPLNETLQYKLTCWDMYKCFYKFEGTEEEWGTYTAATTYLAIYVDTSQLLKECYPTIVKNIGKDSALVGNGNYIDIYMEGLDSVNNWSPIQKIGSYGLSECGGGVGSLILPPENILITLTPKFAGSFYTKLRLKLGKSYSNEFEGWINTSQLKKRY